MSRFVVVFLVVVAGCVATETGNPTARPEIDPGVVDGTVLENDPMLPSPPMVSVRGRAGSVDPAEGRVLGWGVEDSGPPSVSPVQPDGSFEVAVVALPLELVRIQVEAEDGTRSLPFDVRVDQFDGLLLVSAANECVSIDPADRILELPPTAGAEAAIVVVNGCGAPVTRQPADLRSGLGALSLVDDGMLTIPAGARSTIRVRVDDPSSMPEDIVRIAIDSPSAELRAVSVVTMLP